MAVVEASSDSDGRSPDRRSPDGTPLPLAERLKLLNGGIPAAMFTSTTPSLPHTAGGSGGGGRGGAGEGGSAAEDNKRKRKVKGGSSKADGGGAAAERRELQLATVPTCPPEYGVVDDHMLVRRIWVKPNIGVSARHVHA